MKIIIFVLFLYNKIIAMESTTILVISSSQILYFCTFLDRKYKYHGIFMSHVDISSVENIFDKIILVDGGEKELEYHAKILISEYKYENIIAPCEMDILLTARIRDIYKINGQSYQNALFFINKILMKTLCKEFGIKVPLFDKIDCENKDITKYIRSFLKYKNNNKFPLVIKPIDLSGSRDIHIIYNEEDIDNIELVLNPSIKYEIEEYIFGDMYHVDGIYEEGEINICYPSKYINPCLKTSFNKIDCSYIIEKSILSDKLCEITKKIIKILGSIYNFVFHLELFYNSNNEFILCEVGCRTGGNNICDSWEKTFGINLLKEQINIALQKKSLCLMPQTLNILTGSFNIPAKNGKIIKLPEKCILEGILDYKTYYNIDDNIQNTDMFGFKNKLITGFVIGHTEKELLHNLNMFKQWFYENTEII